MSKNKNSIDIKITQLHKQEFKNLRGSQLVLQLSGKTVSPSLVNTLRRLSYSHVPTYAFHKDTINIENNTSIFNNDYMRLRLTQLTIPKVKNQIMFLPEKYWKDIDYADPDREKLPKDNKVLELYINESNTTKDVMNVTTDHVKIFENGQESKDKFKDISPMLIIQLRPNEVFNSRLTAVLGVGKRNDIWSAVGNSYFEELEEDGHKYKLTLESQGQMDEYEILYKACKIFKHKMENLKFIIGDKYNTSDITKQNSLNIVIDNEDHTLGGILNEYLQLNKNVAFSGMTKPDLLIDQIVIKLISVNPNPIKPVFETFDLLDKIFTDIENQIVKLGSKFISVDTNKVNKKIIS